MAVYRTVTNGRLRWVCEVPEFATSVEARTRRDAEGSAADLVAYYRRCSWTMQSLIVGCNRMEKAVASMAEHFQRITDVWHKTMLRQMAVPKQFLELGDGESGNRATAKAMVEYAQRGGQP
ncbi:MAG: hypothetical protein WC683_13090 [bacterium]